MFFGSRTTRPSRIEPAVVPFALYCRGVGENRPALASASQWPLLMSYETTANLMRMLRDSIERVQSSKVSVDDNRALARALAHLWSAHDEIALFARTPPVRAGSGK